MTPATLSQQPRLANTQEIMPYLLTMWQHYDDIPAWGTPGRAAKLREYARIEPILSGALSSMVSKACSLDWQVVGGRNRVKQYQELLAEAEDGKGWHSLLARWTQDYWNTDNGGFLELGRRTAHGPVEGIYHVDAECIGFTSSVTHPVVYTPKLTTGKLSKKDSVRFTPEDFARIVDMESPDEAKLTLGFCAVSRALRVSKVINALYTYDEEKLADMPMPGLVTITGMTMPEVEEAFKLYQAHREDRSQAVFKGLLWLAAQSSPLNPIGANLIPFAGLPENWDREQMFSLYIYTLALVFGVDAREFWPATQSGATKGEAEVQAQKAKGKGFGQMCAAIEARLNWSVLPDGIEFLFDRRNDDDDLAREIWRGTVFTNVRKLWEPPAGAVAGLITTEEARRMLVEAQAVPAWLAPEDNLTLHALDRVLEDAAPEAMPEILKQEKPEPPPAPVTQVVKPAATPEMKPEMLQKAARAQLQPGEDFVAIHRNGDVEVLYTTRRSYAVPVRPAFVVQDARKEAAIAHLQAAGLLITAGALPEEIKP